MEPSEWDLEQRSCQPGSAQRPIAGDSTCNVRYKAPAARWMVLEQHLAAPMSARLSAKTCDWRQHLQCQVQSLCSPLIGILQGPVSWPSAHNMKGEQRSLQDVMTPAHRFTAPVLQDSGEPATCQLEQHVAVQH